MSAVKNNLKKRERVTLVHSSVWSLGPGAKQPLSDSSEVFPCYALKTTRNLGAGSVFLPPWCGKKQPEFTFVDGIMCSRLEYSLMNLEYSECSLGSQVNFFS